MLDFLNSKFMVDLNEGKLPAVTIDNQTIIKLGVMMVIVAAIAILTYRITEQAK